MSTAQTVFVVGLSAVTLVVTLFAVYVVSTTMWSGRWYRRPR